jgi:ATP-binding cassette, subfamily F, member 3
MDEPTNHLDLESSESPAESLSTYDGTLIFVSHNRSFVRKLATRIWSVADGAVETYPGTLDEYMESARLRFAQRDATPAGSASSTTSTNTKSTPSAAKSAPSKPVVVEEAKRESRADEKERRRREAQQRSDRNRKVGPLKRRVEELEARVANLEKAQKERSDLLADPVVYADKQRSSQLISEYKDDSARLSAATEEWERCQAELDSLESENADT